MDAALFARCKTDGNSSSGSQNVFLALRKIQVSKHTAHDRGFTGGFGFSLDSSEDTDTSDMFSLYPSSPPSILLGKTSFVCGCEVFQKEFR